MSSSMQLKFEGGKRVLDVSFKIAFSLSLLAIIRAFSNKALASEFSSLMNFKRDGQVKGSGADGFNKAAQASCLYLVATM